MILRMLRDVVPFERVWKRLYGSTPTSHALISFVAFLEKKLGSRMVFDEERFVHSPDELFDLLELAEHLRRTRVIRSYQRVPNLCDEPRLSLWRARYRDTEEESIAGGGAFNDDRHALVTTLAEALERHIWFERNDYFVSPSLATVEEIAHKGAHITPDSFAGIDSTQRTEGTRHLLITPESHFYWIRGISLHTNTPVWLPAQTVSASSELRSIRQKNKEPLIRRTVTTGLATHPMRDEALALGALEIIERDAYIITWLNQLSPEHVPLRELALENASLQRLLECCARYRLTPYVLRLPTDAPAYATMAIVVDESDKAPHFAFGLKAHRDVAISSEKAILEALRNRRNARTQLQHTREYSEIKKIGHFERVGYWASGDQYKKLTFLLAGKTQQRSLEAWESDSPQQHLARIVAWCTSQGYDCVSVPFTHSAANVTPWHVEMVVIPQMQPIYFSEELPHIGGTRLREVPRKCGFTPRESPFTAEPHPFA